MSDKPKRYRSIKTLVNVGNKLRYNNRCYDVVKAIKPNKCDKYEYKFIKFVNDNPMPDRKNEEHFKNLATIPKGKKISDIKWNKYINSLKLYNKYKNLYGKFYGHNSTEKGYHYALSLMASVAKEYNKSHVTSFDQKTQNFQLAPFCGKKYLELYKPLYKEIKDTYKMLKKTIKNDVDKYCVKK